MSTLSPGPLEDDRELGLPDEAAIIPYAVYAFFKPSCILMRHEALFQRLFSGGLWEDLFQRVWRFVTGMKTNMSHPEFLKSQNRA